MLKKIGLFILDFLFMKIARAIKDWYARHQKEKEIEEANREDRERTEAAQTPEEREEAAREVIRNS